MIFELNIYLASIQILLYALGLQIILYIIVKIFYSNIPDLKINRIFAFFTLLSLFLALLIHIYSLTYQPFTSYFFPFDSTTGLLIATTNSQYLSLIILFFALLSFGSIYQSFIIQKLYFIEFYIIFLLCIITALFITLSNNLFFTYTLIELLTLAYFILASFKRTSTFSSESGVKYFIVGSIISCIFILGISLIYHHACSLNLYSIQKSLDSLIIQDYLMNSDVLEYKFGIFLIIFSIFCKLGLIPFHFWTLDVYEGSPLGATILFSFLTKIILIDFFAKFLLVFKNFFTYTDFDILLSIAIFSIFFGAFMTLMQTRMKRFLIYSSITQIGFSISAFIVGCKYSELLISFYKIGYLYIIIYTFIMLLLWNLYTNFYYYFISRNSNEGNFYLTDFSKIKNTNESWFLLIILIFLTASGIPPFAGFFLKWTFGKVFLDIYLSNKILVLLIIFIVIIIISIISMYYYLRILKFLSDSFVFFRDNFIISKIDKSYFLNTHVDDIFIIYYNFFIILFLLNFLYSCIFFESTWFNFMDLIICDQYMYTY